MNDAWAVDAACAGHPEPEIWFAADSGVRPSDRRKHDQDPQVEKALAICRVCTVRAACLTEAYRLEARLPAHDGRTGIRGGLTPRQRSLLLARRRKATP